MRRFGSRALGLLAFSAVVAAAARAQGNYEVQVYGAPTIAPHTTMFELHTNFTFQGSKGIGADGTHGTNHALHETIEITHGFTDWLEIGFYQFVSIRQGAGVQ